MLLNRFGLPSPRTEYYSKSDKVVLVSFPPSMYSSPLWVTAPKLLLGADSFMFA